MNLREAAQLALDALQNHSVVKHPQQVPYRDKAIDALKEALAEPETFMHEYKHQAYGYYTDDGALKLGPIPETKEST